MIKLANVDLCCVNAGFAGFSGLVGLLGSSGLSLSSVSLLFIENVEKLRVSRKAGPMRSNSTTAKA